MSRYTISGLGSGEAPAGAISPSVGLYEMLAAIQRQFGPARQLARPSAIFGMANRGTMTQVAPGGLTTSGGQLGDTLTVNLPDGKAQVVRAALQNPAIKDLFAQLQQRVRELTASGQPLVK